MGEIRELKTKRSTVNDGIVDRLEEVLAAAKKGDLKGIAVSMVFNDYTTGTMIEHDDCRATVIGAVALTMNNLYGNVREPWAQPYLLPDARVCENEPEDKPE